MLTRRHIRIKAMQIIYAAVQSGNTSLKAAEVLLTNSLKDSEVLYYTMWSLLREIAVLSETHSKKIEQKYFPAAKELIHAKKVSHNRLFKMIRSNTYIIDAEKRFRITNWNLDSKYVSIIYTAILESTCYKDYVNSDNDSFDEDCTFLVSLYRDVIAPNDNLYEYVEEQRLTWIDDFPVVNTAILKVLESISELSTPSFVNVPIFKDKSDESFTFDILAKTLSSDASLQDIIDRIALNWDPERIAKLDTVIIKMALCEALNFETIPLKVTMNEYIEIAKEYATPKSSIFINGILDKAFKEFQNTKLISKQNL